MNSMHVFSLTLLLFLMPICLFSQEKVAQTKGKIKSGQIFINKKLSYYFENDTYGNRIFTKNDGMNGQVTMLSADEYDTLNRSTRSFFAHSNIGFSINEFVYEDKLIKGYEYFTSSEATKSFDRTMSNNIDSRETFLQSDIIQNLLKGNKRLSKITTLDSLKNVLTEVYIPEKGDTTIIKHHYNINNKEDLFQYRTTNSPLWNWDIFQLYDDKSNLIQSYRISLGSGNMDTTEVHNYIYNQ